MPRVFLAAGSRRGNQSFFTLATVTVMRKDLEGVGVSESSVSAEEGEFAVGELLFPAELGAFRRIATG